MADGAAVISCGLQCAGCVEQVFGDGHRPGPAGYDDERRDAIRVQIGGAFGDAEVMPAEYQQALGGAHRDAQAQVIPQLPGVVHIGDGGRHWPTTAQVLRVAISLM
jgi:hypothetical protein